MSETFNPGAVGSGGGGGGGGGSGASAAFVGNGYSDAEAGVVNPVKLLSALSSATFYAEGGALNDGFDIYVVSATTYLANQSDLAGYLATGSAGSAVAPTISLFVKANGAASDPRTLSGAAGSYLLVVRKSPAQSTLPVFLYQSS